MSRALLNENTANRGNTSKLASPKIRKFWGKNCTMKIIQKSLVAQQESHKRKILLCVTGLSPQIVTETLYALAVAQDAPWIPSEIRLLTTTRGAENAKLMLLSEQPGWFHRLCQDWSLPRIAFDDSHIEVIANSAGQPLQDILDDADNQCAADSIADCVRRLTQDDSTEIHASIAGGRKTMGFFLGYAMSLWGRGQDRLSHVLVSSPYESRAEFFYPTPTPFVIPAKDRGQDPLDASKARVWLGDIPFVRLRHLLPETLRAGQGKFADAVSAANTALDQISLDIDIARSSIRINGTSLRLQPMQFALLTLLAWRQKKHMPPLQAPSKEIDEPEWKRQALRDLQEVLGEMNIPDSVYQRLTDAKAMGDTFNEQLSKFKKALRDSGALPFRELIVRTEEQARARQRSYQLALSADQIHFVHRETASKLAKTGFGSLET
jgi:CRISPR-associated protein (TIGR02584 family)